jgi:hypothetical protein
MTVAAKQARLLQDVSGPAAAELVPIVASQAAFMADVASVIETPWNMSTGPTSPFPAREAAGTKGPLPVLPLTSQMGPRVRIRFPPAESQVRT